MTRGELWSGGRLLVLVLAFSIGGCGQGEISPEQRLERATAALEKDEARTAIIELKNLLQSAPANRDARLLLGKIYARYGDGASAEKELRRARDLGASELDVQPWLARALLLQGRVEPLYDLEIPAEASTDTRAEMLWIKSRALASRGDMDAAEELARESLELRSDSAEALLAMARIEFRRGNLPQAQDWIARALAADDTHGPAWGLLGDLERSTGNIEAAEQAYTRAMEDKSVEYANRMSRALVLIDMEEYERAQEDVAVLRESIMKHPGIDYVEGLLKYRQQDFAGAQRLAEAALGADPAFAQALLLAGASNLALGNKAAAEKHLARYLAQNPEDDAAARRMMASLKLQLGEAAEAEQILRPLVEESPDDILAINLLASSLLAQGKGEESIDYLKRVKQEQPESAVAGARLGAALLSEGESSEGLRELEKALEVDPSMQEAAARAVMGHVRSGDLDKALEVAIENQERNPDSVRAQSMVGVVRLFRKEMQPATEAFEKALEMEPGNPVATSALAAIAIGAGDLEKAKRYYKESLKNQPDNTGALVNLATLAVQQGDEDAARRYLEEAIGKDPQALEPRLHLASLYMRKGDAAQSLSVLADIHPANARDPRLLGLRADAELAVGRYASARETLEDLQTLVPEDPRLHLALAKAYAGLGDTAKTRTELEAAVRLDPKFEPAIAALAQLAVQRGDVDDAAVRLQELKNRLGSEDSQVILLEGQVADLKGDLSAAAAAYRRLFELTGTNTDLRRLSRVYWKAGRRDEAVQVLERWVETHPDDGAVHFELAERYLVLGRRDDAIDGYERALGANPRNVVAMNNLAWLLRERDPAKALEYAETAYSYAPDDPNVMDTLAVLLLAKGEVTRAASISKQAVRKQPANGSLLYHRAQILDAEGKRDEAKSVLQNALTSDPDFPERSEAQSMLDSLGRQ